MEFLKTHHLNEAYLFIYLFLPFHGFLAFLSFFKAALLQPKDNFQDILKELHSQCVQDKRADELMRVILTKDASTRGTEMQFVCECANTVRN